MPILDDNAFWESCDEIFEDEGDVYDINRKRNHTRKHRVITKFKEMSAISVGLCPLLPKAGSVYEAAQQTGGNIVPVEVDLNAILIHQHAAREFPKDAGAWNMWIVTSDYSTDIPYRSDSPSKSDKPEEDLATIEWDFEQAQEARQHDLKGKPYLTTAGQPFSPPKIFEVDYPVLSVSRNELTYDYNRASSFSRALNELDFLGAPRGCVQCLPPKSQQKMIGRLRYWRTSYKFRFRALQEDGGYTFNLPTGSGYIDESNVAHAGPVTVSDSWQPFLLNAGVYRLGVQGKDMDSVVGLPIPIMRHGHQIHHPVCLNHLGQEIKQPALPADPHAWFTRFTNFRYRSFQELLVVGLV